MTTDTRQIAMDDTGVSGTRVPALVVAWHPDPARVGQYAILDELRLPASRTSLSRLLPDFAIRGATPRPLETAFISRRPILLERLADGTVALSTTDTTTTVVADEQPVTRMALFTPEALNRGVVLELASQVVLVLTCLAPGSARPLEVDGIVGISDAILELRESIMRAARGEASVLIRGPTGSGKELVARAVHARSGRAKQPLVAVNMGAIPPTLAATELFGHAAGAFSGAQKNHRGHFERADGGSLFLDEIGETPIDVQPLLLRTLETGEVQPLGTERSRKLNVRLIAATDADIEDAVTSGRFRAPLLYRLAAQEVRVPPLADRRSDVGLLLVRFLREELGDAAAGLLAPAEDGRGWLRAAVVARLVAYRWPGNVRQLRNVAKALASIALSGGGKVTTDHPELARLLHVPPTPSPAPEAALGPRRTATVPISRGSIGAITEEMLEAALEAEDWKLGPTAVRLGISRPTLNELVDKSSTLRRAHQLTDAEVLEAHRNAAGDDAAAARALRVSHRAFTLRLRDVTSR